jgi:cytochrome c-type biogenesis protein CcmE
VKPKNQRLVLILLALAAVGGAVLLAMSALRSQAAFFYSPADVIGRGRPPADRAVRIGGMVRQGSIRRHADGVTIDFLVGDETPHVIRVRYRGITPDLFRENSGVVAEGRFQADGLFVASEILAKHDENYMPAEAAGEGQHKSGSLE